MLMICRKRKVERVALRAWERGLLSGFRAAAYKSPSREESPIFTLYDLDHLDRYRRVETIAFKAGEGAAKRTAERVQSGEYPERNQVDPDKLPLDVWTRCLAEAQR